MKLQFLQAYPNSSITEKFDDIVLNDFTVITGKNGVGKTHLLEAIVHNDNYINIDEGLNAIYFNYNDFIVESAKANQQKNKSQLKKKNTNANYINQELQDIKSLFNKKTRNTLIQAFRSQNNLVSQIHSNFANKISFLDLPSWENARTELFKFSKDEELLKKIYTRFQEDVYLFSQNQNEKFDMYYNKSNELKIPFQQLNNSHFEYQETWLGQLLENEFKEYIKNYDRAKKEVEYTSNENITKREIKEKTIEKVGIAPWNILNDILEKYSCNGYIIDKELINTIESFVDINQQPLNIKLKNYVTNKTISLDRLSSGEKTLFALAVSLYRQEKDETLPTVLLLDEIDSSLHPSMSKQLLDVLENVFVKKYGLKIIMVTHSPSTVALAPDDSVYVMENDNGKITLSNRNKQEAINFLSDGFATFNDGLSFLDRLLNTNKKISILTEGKNTLYLEKAIELIEPDLSKDIEIIKGAESKTGKTQLKILFDFVSKIQHNQKIFFVWDCDCTEYCKFTEENNIVPFVFDKNKDNKIAKKGIENLFDEYLFEDFYTEIKKSDSTIQKYFEENRKNDFLHLIEGRNEKEDFKNFKSLLEKIKEKI